MGNPHGTRNSAGRLLNAERDAVFIKFIYPKRVTLVGVARRPQV